LDRYILALLKIGLFINFILVYIYLVIYLIYEFLLSQTLNLSSLLINLAFNGEINLGEKTGTTRCGSS
jgi:hypothetical protein